MPKISLIIPLYNAVRHLRPCLDSVTRQSFADFEVILVNDGSADGTAEIVEEYCRRYPHFRLINQKNGGVSAARNRGMAESNAPFLAFLDQDDLLHPQALEILYQMAEVTAADVAAFRIRLVPDDFAGDPQPQHFNVAEAAAAAHFSRSPITDFFQTVKGGPIYIWNKLYRRAALGDVEFPLGVQPAEDTVFTLKMLLTVKTLVSTDLQLLYYRNNDASVTKQGITEKYVRSHALAAGEIKRFIDGLSLHDQWLCRRLDFYLSRFIFKSLISQPLRLISGPDRPRRLETSRELAATFLQNGALKPSLLGWKKALLCRLYFKRCYRAAKFLA